MALTLRGQDSPGSPTLMLWDMTKATVKDAMDAATGRALTPARAVTSGDAKPSDDFLPATGYVAFKLSSQSFKKGFMALTPANPIHLGGRPVRVLDSTGQHSVTGASVNLLQPTAPGAYPVRLSKTHVEVDLRHAPMDPAAPYMPPAWNIPLPDGKGGAEAYGLDSFRNNAGLESMVPFTSRPGSGLVPAYAIQKSPIPEAQVIKIPLNGNTLDLSKYANTAALKTAINGKYVTFLSEDPLVMTGHVAPGVVASGGKWAGTLADGSRVTVAVQEIPHTNKPSAHSLRSPQNNILPNQVYKVIVGAELECQLPGLGFYRWEADYTRLSRGTWSGSKYDHVSDRRLVPIVDIKAAAAGAADFNAFKAAIASW